MLNVDLSLSSFPAKIRRPVQALRDAGHIDDRAITTVLLGAPREDQRHLFLGNLLVVRGLRDAKIEVDDTVAMAAEVGRSVDFRWSQRRWGDEHNRLSRWLTLRKLTEATKTYDSTAYREHLPATWPGYLIPNSRRLGMEGLRQRHCVASYDAQIAIGQCAIAVVFVDHRRWTVELFLTRDPEQPVYVRQIKGRLNRHPSQEEREAVLRALDMPLSWQRVPVVHETHDRRYKAIGALEAALPVLRAAGIAHVCVTFDGSGDSGMIDDPEFYDANSNPVSISTLTCAVPVDGGQDVRSLKDALYQAVEDYLDSTDVNWYDNDGGYGEFDLDVAAGVFESSIYCRYTESNCEHSEEYELTADADNRPQAAHA